MSKIENIQEQTCWVWFLSGWVNLGNPFLIVFLRPHLLHMKVPRLGVESELQLQAYTTATAAPNPALSATYTTAHNHARSLTHRVRPGIEPASSWILVRLVTAEPQ